MSFSKKESSIFVKCLVGVCLVFVFYPINMAHCIDSFSYVEVTLYSWDKSHLVIMYYAFYILLDSVCSHFINDICIYILIRHWSNFLAFWCVWLWYKDNTDFIKLVGM